MAWNCWPVLLGKLLQARMHAYCLHMIECRGARRQRESVCLHAEKLRETTRDRRRDEGEAASRQRSAHMCACTTIMRQHLTEAGMPAP